ncbi:MAG: hypothetical protein HY600_00600 [Candidatus Omnitrophica bacterium]|nr:hypothetical protein [Candidatus Omnitrophota bacterium]
MGGVSGTAAASVQDHPVGQTQGVLAAVDPQTRIISVRKSWISPTAMQSPVEEYVLGGEAVVMEGSRRRGMETLQVGDQVTIEYYAEQGQLVASGIYRGTGQG